MYSAVKCKKCRQILFNDSYIKTSLISAHSDSFTRETDEIDCSSLDELVCLAEDKLPDWIISLIQENNWSKGKINCNHCSARLGSFDFISGIKCACRSFILPPVHLVKSKVDLVHSG